ncbi:MFS transporter [Bacillus songklensis]|uniref:MFS transporter n=1 Tax=Bacillus songklensis TaxID=1069116 RepID=A0ABV8B4T7_9BACI
MGELRREEAERSRNRRTSFTLYFSFPVLGWALYDFANTIFSSNITTIFFPFYLQEVIGTNDQLNQIASTFISYANAVASLLLVMFSPLFGVMIDQTGRKKRPLSVLALLSILCTVGMGLSALWQGDPFLSLAFVILLFVLAKFFYHSSLIFYDTMISDLGAKEDMPLISGFGVAVGYIGTLVGLLVYPFIGDGQFHQAFIPTAVLYFLFTLPLLLWVKEKKEQREESSAVSVSFLSGYREIMETFREIKSYKPIFLFMVTYFFINDAIATTITMMAVYAKAVVGFTTNMFIILYLVSTLASIIGSFAFGYVTKKAGAAKGVTYVALILIIALILAVTAVHSTVFWVAGSLFGVALGAMWVTTRTLIVELAPPHKRGQFFGLFAFSGKVSAILGPVVYGTITLVFAHTGSLASRLALSSLLVFTLIGLLVHFKTPYEQK